MKYAALLRGINVGGKNMLPMKALAAIFEATGCKNVETYIQSGNVVFKASSALAKRLPQRISEAIAERYGYQVPVIVRSAAELRASAAGNPYLRESIPPNQLHLYFLGEQPSTAALTGLDPDRSLPDEFVVIGHDIYVRAPNGVGRSKLTNVYFESKLKVICTARNWATVLRLAAITNS